MTSETSGSSGQESRKRVCQSGRQPESVLDLSGGEFPDMEPRKEPEREAIETETRYSEQPDSSDIELALSEGEDPDSPGGEQEKVRKQDPHEGKAKRSYILIRKAASLEEFHKLDDAESAESMIARGRGGSEVAGREGGGNGQGDGGELRFEEGNLQVETGYVMEFVDERMTDLPIYDIISIPDKPCYAVSQEVLESLPGWARTRLNRNGHLKCSGVYDKDSKEFRKVRPGWSDLPRSSADALVEMLQEFNGEHLARPVYYYLNQYASTEYADPEAIAELRGIQKSTVEGEIRKASERLATE